MGPKLWPWVRVRLAGPSCLRGHPRRRMLAKAPCLPAGILQAEVRGWPLAGTCDWSPGLCTSVGVHRPLLLLPKLRELHCLGHFFSQLTLSGPCLCSPSASVPPRPAHCIANQPPRQPCGPAPPAPACVLSPLPAPAGAPVSPNALPGHLAQQFSSRTNEQNAWEPARNANVLVLIPPNHKL